MMNTSDSLQRIAIDKSLNHLPLYLRPDMLVVDGKLGSE